MAGHAGPFTGRSAYVLVLGDIGRSPRTCNHAVSLANVGFDVTLMGYDQGSNLHESIRSSPQITVSAIRTYPQWLSSWLPRPVSLILKAFWQFITLFCFALPHWRAPDLIMVQNPPTIPTLIVTVVYNFFHRRTKVVLDWHNYGYSILQMSFSGSPNHPLVMLARYIESTFGPRVAAAFCVSRAMKKDLFDKWNINATVLYDRPLDTFRPCSIEEKYHLMSKLAALYPDLDPIKIFQTVDEESPRLRVDRPGVLVSSTSWTPDEDFGILFEALNIYESRCEQEGSTLPNLICVITGKGPLKEHYRNLIKEQQWRFVKVVMPWLEPQDYPLMLGSADLGVCLHTSSSGVDLPMKVVDMFGCGLPVVAKSFPALPELVKDGINGILFNTPKELADSIVKWFTDFPNVSYENRRRQFANQIERFRAAGWSDHWRAVALPVFQNLL